MKVTLGLPQIDSKKTLNRDQHYFDCIQSIDQNLENISDYLSNNDDIQSCLGQLKIFYSIENATKPDNQAEKSSFIRYISSRIVCLSNIYRLNAKD